MSISRREMLRYGTGAAALLAGAGCAQSSPAATQAAARPIDFDISRFYAEDGRFRVDVAKQAYLALMKFHGYVAPPDASRRLWVSDFGKNHFTRLGYGALLYVNDRRQRYMMRDLFLLPNQMKPECYQVPIGEIPASRETWLVRHGLVYCYSEGSPTPDMKAVLPWSHMSGTAITSHETVLRAGESAQLEREGAPHWHYGGPDGAVFTEASGFFDEDGLRHTDQTLDYLKGGFLQTDRLL